MDKSLNNKIIVLGFVTILIIGISVGCLPPGTVGGKIETPNAIRHFLVKTPLHQDNIITYQRGAVRDHGTINNVTNLGDSMSQQMLEDQGFCQNLADRENEPMCAVDLSGVAFTIDFHDQWGHGIFGDNFNDNLHHIAVLEFILPVNDQYAYEINWFLEPRLVCSYEIEELPSTLVPSGQAPARIDEPSLSFNFIVVEDSIGLYDLMKVSDILMVDALMKREYGAEESFFKGESSGNIDIKPFGYDYLRNGTMTILPGIKARLFLGIGVHMDVHQQGDRIRIGGSRLPKSVLDSDRCTFDFGTQSYYAGKRVQSGE